MNDDADPLKIEIPAFLKRQTEPKGPTCSGCRFMIVDDKQMVCRRHPPTAQVIMMPGPPTLQSKGIPTMRPQTLSAWPLVMADWWCGEHAAALAGTTEKVVVDAPNIPLDTWVGSKFLAPEPHPSLVPRMEGDDRE